MSIYRLPLDIAYIKSYIMLVQMARKDVLDDFEQGYNKKQERQEQHVVTWYLLVLHLLVDFACRY